MSHKVHYWYLFFPRCWGKARVPRVKVYQNKSKWIMTGILVKNVVKLSHALGLHFCFNRRWDLDISTYFWNSIQIISPYHPALGYSSVVVPKTVGWSSLGGATPCGLLTHTSSVSWSSLFPALNHAAIKLHLQHRCSEMFQWTLLQSKWRVVYALAPLLKKVGLIFFLLCKIIQQNVRVLFCFIFFGLVSIL